MVAVLLCKNLGDGYTWLGVPTLLFNDVSIGLWVFIVRPDRIIVGELTALSFHHYTVS